MLRLLEVRVGIKEEHFLELPLVKVVCEIFHRVGANARDVLILVGMQMPQHFDPVLHEVADFDSDLHADRNFVGESLAKTDKETAVATANISHLALPVADVWIQLCPRLMTIVRLAIELVWMTWAKNTRNTRQLEIQSVLPKNLLNEVVIADGIAVGSLSIESLLRQANLLLFNVHFCF